jgi:sialate O-acetylesterase
VSSSTKERVFSTQRAVFFQHPATKHQPLPRVCAKTTMRTVALLFAFAASAAATACHVSNVLGTNMVLQRDRPANVWGYADAGVSVTVSLNGAKMPAATADATGKWLTALPAQPATTAPSTLSFSCSDGTTPADITNVLFGDVHLCSGQSNMQFTLTSNAGVPNATAEIALANSYPHIRVFTVGDGTSSTTPLTELKTIAQNWSVASNASIGGPGWAYMSAVCWFTYRDLYDALGGSVPQGLISTNWGGTPIQHWSSPDALKTCNGGTDSTLWNAMVVPYVSGPMAVRTAIWYQGEAKQVKTRFMFVPPRSLASPSTPLRTPDTPSHPPFAHAALDKLLIMTASLRQ